MKKNPRTVFQKMIPNLYEVNFKIVVYLNDNLAPGSIVMEEEGYTVSN